MVSLRGAIRHTVSVYPNLYCALSLAAFDEVVADTDQNDQFGIRMADFHDISTAQHIWEVSDRSLGWPPIAMLYTLSITRRSKVGIAMNLAVGPR